MYTLETFLANNKFKDNINKKSVPIMLKDITKIHSVPPVDQY